ncbi:MAG: T9SS C-terminal target domain-containing protein [Bacteroidetes bacterium]|nr:MAG: T9SS C-terminal target domain-containing protein [Bacteroidota bacterium]
MKKTLLFTLMMAFAAMVSFSQWSDDPSENVKVVSLTNEQALSKTVVGPTGDYYIGFFSQEGGNYNVRLQRLDSQGNRLWADEGLLISDHPAMSWLTDWDMTVDNDNHAILTWQDIRSGGNINVVAYRISPEGAFMWGSSGIMLSDSDAFDASPKVTITKNNHAVFAWQSNNNIIRQKVSAGGVKQWGDWGITMSGTNRFAWPQLMPAGQDDVLMKFYEDSGPSNAPTRILKVQRFGSDGQPVWTSETIITDEGTIQAWLHILSFVPDENDGFYIAWHDYTLSGTQSSAWIQHVNASGEPQFATNGALLSNRNNFNQFNPKIAQPAESEDVFVFWTEVSGNQNQWGVYGQRLNALGEIKWSEAGKEIFAVGSDNYNLFHTLQAEEDMIIIYDKNYHLYAARLDESGEFEWENEQVLITNASSGGTHPEVTQLFNNQWVFAWEDGRTGSANVYAQNLFPDGTMGIAPVDPDIFEVTFNVDLSAVADYFNPEQDVIYIAGSITEWAEPGSEPETQTMTRVGNTMTWTLTLGLEAGEYHYKYFMNQGWEGGEWQGDPNRVVVINDDITLEDTWSPSSIRTLQLTASPENAGTPEGAGTYHTNAHVTVSAEAAENFQFIQWTSGDQQVSTDEIHAFFMPAEDYSLTAHFELLAPETYTLTLVAEPETGGTVAGGGEYEAGQEVTLTAVPNQGYVFVAWYDDEENEISVQESFQFTMPQTDVTLIAYFSVTPFVGNTETSKLTIHPNPASSSFTVSSGNLIRSIEIMDLTGRRVFQTPVSDTQVSINTSLPKGLYLVKVYTESGAEVRKLQIR